MANFSIHYALKNIKLAYNNNKFKISAPTWNNVFDFPDRSYSISGIQDYFFQCIMKKHETIANSTPVRTYENKIKNGIVFKRKAGYEL